MSLAVVISSLLSLDDIVALDANIIAAHNKYAVGPGEEVPVPEEKLVPDHALDAAFLVEEGTFLVDNLDLIVYLYGETLAIS